jgi:predicted permease
MGNIAFSLGIISFGLLIGYTIQVLIHKNILHLPFGINTLRKRLQYLALLLFDPIIYLGAIWIIDLGNLKIITLPFIGVLALILGGVSALIIAGLLKMPRKQTGSFIISGSFTNIGLVGAFICFTFFGDAGFALASFYKLLEMFIYYAFGFPIAGYYGSVDKNSGGIAEKPKSHHMNPFMFVAFVSMIVGILLNIFGIERPHVFSNLISVLIPVATTILLASIGMAVNLHAVGNYLKEGFLVALIKFIIVPLVIVSVSSTLGLGRIDQGLPLKVVLILSSMPVGFTALVPSTLYDLDVDLANASWIITTALLFVVVPMLSWLVKII